MPKSIPATPSGPRRLGPYSVAAEAPGFVFVSGQVALDPTTGERSPDDVAMQARRALDNIRGILADVGLTMDDVVKTTIFLVDMGDFAAVNEVYATYFGDEPPARSTVAVAALPSGFLVEIEAIAAR
jgi:2-iminobutanoate/2-iminopropanoate deaminase